MTGHETRTDVDTDEGDKDASVVIVTQYFDPDTAANSILLSDLAYGLADRGVDVSVVTTQPSYTDGDRAEKQPGRETIDGVDVRRLPATRFDRNEGLAKRMLNELTFFLVAFAYLLARRRGDVLLLPTAPSFLPLAVVAFRWRGYRSVPIVMDLYPQMAVALGYVDENSVIRRGWDWLNRRAYRRAALTVTIGGTMAERIREAYGPVPIRVIHNWEDEEFVRPTEKVENSFACEHGFDDDTLTVLYSGNLGRHHELESVIDAATQLEHDDVDGARFVFIGDGGKKTKLRKLAHERDLDSVTFLPYQPKEVLPHSLTCGDVALVTMDRSVVGLCVPSKFYTALASGQAILAVAVGDSEIAQTVRRHDCGIHVEPDREEALADAIRFWLENPDHVEEMGKTAREVFEERFARDRAVEEYHEVIRAVAPGAEIAVSVALEVSA